MGPADNAFADGCAEVGEVASDVITRLTFAYLGIHHDSIHNHLHIIGKPVIQFIATCQKCPNVSHGTVPHAGVVAP